MKVFVVEDDPIYAKYLKHAIELNPDHEAKVFTTGKELMEGLTFDADVITVDYMLPDISCELLIKRIRKANKSVQIIAISAQEEISTAVKLLKQGVYDYIEKNEETRDRLVNTIKHIGENKSLEIDIENLRLEVQEKFDFKSVLIGNHSSMDRVFDLMAKAASSKINVSVTGETGTGKELVAKAIHYNSPFNKKRIVTVNMAAIPKELMESELFGHEKGAFTGAVNKRIGKFEEAQGSTLFLDEIAELDLSLQAKLLRALQDKEVTRVGGNTAIKLNIRVIVATHKNLAEEVRQGNFREDLYFRLLGLPISIPPLRARGKDILMLALHFLDEYVKENKCSRISLHAQSQEKLLEYFWPGNVRELKAVIELAAVMSNGKVILPEDIVLHSTRSTPEFLYKEMTLQDYNTEIVSHFLKTYNGNVLEVADRLAVGKSTIYRMLKDGRIKHS
jgi:DNA-binding NtrC family response regulator